MDKPLILRTIVRNSDYARPASRAPQRHAPASWQAGSGARRQPGAARPAATINALLPPHPHWPREQRQVGTHAPDEAVLRRQGGVPGPAAVLPDGGLLRAVLRRRTQGRAVARHHADPARQFRGRAHPDGRGAGACLRGLPGPTCGAGRIGGDLRTDRRPRTGQGPGGTQGGARGDAGHGDRRGPAQRTPRHATHGGRARALGLRVGLGGSGRWPLPGQRGRERRRAGGRTRAA